MNKDSGKSNFEKLKDVITELRDPVHGCPWDLKQTHESLLKRSKKNGRRNRRRFNASFITFTTWF